MDNTAREIVIPMTIEKVTISREGLRLEFSDDAWKRAANGKRTIDVSPEPRPIPERN